VHAAAAVDLDVDLLPEFDVATGIALPHTCFRKFSI
jgi:hypothetical protein